MRDIKFRAWDEKGKKIVTWDKLEQINIWWSHSDYEPLMQYTGLTDKNGVEIYEGDIVNFLENYGFAGWHESDNPGVVEFNKGQYLVKGSQLSLAGDISQHGVEVIGNIMENPELLK